MDKKTMMQGINKFFYFAMNYPYGFIKKVWSDDEPLANHLEGKFDALHRSYGPMGVMNAFYAELDGRNRVKLLNWVAENYDDEIELNIEKYGE